MPIHDWTRVDAGVVHHFHGNWITQLGEALNEGLLPRGFYAMSEQHAGRIVADILTLEVEGVARGGTESGGVAVAAPRVARAVKASPTAQYRMLRRTIAIRHVSRHRLVAVIEVLSPTNEDRQASVNDFVAKAHGLLQAGCHLLLIDLFPPGKFDPHGIHEEIWSWYGDANEPIEPLAKPFTLAAYVASKAPDAHLEAVAVGEPLPEMPLFLDINWHVNVPLETTYAVAYRGVPSIWRDVLEAASR